MWVLAHSICLPAQEVASSPISSLDIELLAQSKSKIIPEKFCWRGSLTEVYLDSLSGTMLQPSESTTQTHEATLNGSEKGVGNSSFVAGSRNCVKTSAQLAKAQESTVSEADSGRTWQGSFAKYDHDMSLWKTAQCSLLGDSEEFSETWPRWGSMLNGELLERQISELRTNGIEFGLWPTPCSSDHSNRQISDSIHISRTGLPKHIAANGMKSQMRLSQAVKMFPTPNASDANKWSNQTLQERLEKKQQVRLNTAVAPEGGKGGLLNPNWVEWLMGWPIGWTDLRPLETAKCHCAQPLHGNCSQKSFDCWKRFFMARLGT